MPQTYSTDVFKRQMTEKYFDMVYRLAFSSTKDGAHADDVCQEVFYKFLKTHKEFESEEHVKAWLIRVTVNQCKSLFTSSWFKKNRSYFGKRKRTCVYHARKKRFAPCNKKTSSKICNCHSSLLLRGFAHCKNSANS